MKAQKKMNDPLPPIVRINPNVLFQDLEEEAVLLNLETEMYHSLNDIGSRMWQLLAEEENTAVVLAQLLKEYDVNEQQLRQDFAAWLQELLDQNLISTSGI